MFRDFSRSNCGVALGRVSYHGATTAGLLLKLNKTNIMPNKIHFHWYIIFPDFIDGKIGFSLPKSCFGLTYLESGWNIKIKGSSGTILPVIKASKISSCFFNWLTYVDLRVKYKIYIYNLLDILEYFSYTNVPVWLKQPIC